MFLYSTWLGTDLMTRVKLAEIFHIQKKGSTHVQDNRIVSDGYDIKEIETALSTENLQTYLKTKETDPNKLWELLLISLNAPTITPTQASEPVVKLTRVTGTKKRAKNK